MAKKEDTSRPSAGKNPAYSAELRGRSTHYKLASEAALELGFSPEEARIIAKGCEEVDKYFKPGENLKNYWRHFDPLAWLPFRRDSREFFADYYLNLALETCDLHYLGSGLHGLQDKYAHGLIPFQKDLPLLKMVTGTWRDDPQRNAAAFKKAKNATSEYLARFLVIRDKKQA